MGSSTLEPRPARIFQDSPRLSTIKTTLLRFALSGLLAIGLAPFLAVSAQTLDDYAQRQVFDFEQCANACQIELDQQVFSCGPFREDKSRAMPEDCFESNYDQYERCMNACPADPRKQP